MSGSPYVSSTYFKQGGILISLLLVLAAVLGFLSGSIWLFTAALGALMVKMYPILLIAIAIAGGGLLAFKYYFRR
jgi:hypothetical protein